MKVLVAVKRVADPNVRVRVMQDNSGVDLSGVCMTMNPFDEIALAEAVRLREGGAASEVVAVSAGDASCEEVLRTALAVGADRAVRIAAGPDLEPLAVAKLLAEVVRAESPRLVLMGKQAVDGDCNQTGQMLAALLDWPQATFASALHVTGECAVVDREVDGGILTVEVDMPAVVTADLRLNAPRYPSLRGMLKARKAAIAVVPAAGGGAPRLATLRVESSPRRRAGIRVASAAELVRRLRDEAGVL